jgi:serine/threonine-protein phosphatase PGAM5
VIKIATWGLAALLGLPSAAIADAPVGASRTLVLVRHGHYERLEGGDERSGMGLSALGVAQSRLVADRLATQAAGFDDRRVSPLRRARDTAATIGSGAAKAVFDIDEDLAECTPPTRRREIIADEKPEVLAACRTQLDRAFARYFKRATDRDRNELLVCHGNVIRYFVTRALGVDTEAWLEMSVGHASLTTIRVEPDGRMKVIAVGDVGHLPRSMLTGATGDPERDLSAPALRVRHGGE